MSSPSSLLLTLLVIFLCASLATARLREEFVVEQVVEDGKIETVTPQEETNEGTCEVNNNKSLSAIMEKVCEICHDMISDREPNTRANCRANCFKNDQFRSCLRLFAPQQTRATRHHHHTVKI